METVLPELLRNPPRLLQKELERRTERNPRYSLRAFARSMGMSHTVLSLVLSGKRPLSKKAAAQVADFLELNPVQREELLRHRRGNLPAARGDESARVASPTEYHDLSLDAFAAMSDWYHYAILSLLELEDARYEARWIARRLGVTEMQARGAMERLERLGLVEERDDGRWRQSTRPLKIGNTVSTAATRKFHRQLIEKALESMENDPIELRDLSSMTFVLDPQSIPHAMKRIQAFRRELAAELEVRGQPREVYNLTVQLYPVTRNPDPTKKERTR